MKVLKVLNGTNLQEVTRLEIGSGEAPLDGYTHLDIREGLPHLDIVCDFSGLPFEKDQLQEIRCSQVIEHIPRWLRIETLKEWYRALKPGGFLWADTPNLEGWTKEFAEGKVRLREFVDRIYGGQEDQWNVHYVCYTPELAMQELAEAGFNRVEMLEETCWTDLHFKAHKKKDE